MGVVGERPAGVAAEGGVSGTARCGPADRRLAQLSSSGREVQEQRAPRRCPHRPGPRGHGREPHHTALEQPVRSTCRQVSSWRTSIITFNQSDPERSITP